MASLRPLLSRHSVGTAAVSAADGVSVGPYGLGPTEFLPFILLDFSSGFVNSVRGILSGHNSHAAFFSPCIHACVSLPCVRFNHAKEGRERMSPWTLKQTCLASPLSPREPKHVMPGPTRGCLSLFSLHWMTGLIWKVHRGTISTDDVWYLRVSWMVAGDVNDV